MIDLYTWKTPNGRKASIMLEEIGLPYKVYPIQLGKGEQHSPEYLAINPNNKIPAIVDREGPDGNPLTLFESGAILIYLAEKTGKFMPEAPRARFEVIQWLMFQMGGVGPIFGQAHHFMGSAKEKNSLCDRTVPQGNASALQRVGEASREGGVSGRGIFNCGYRNLSLGRPL